jgi:hypothetical protein
LVSAGTRMRPGRASGRQMKGSRCPVFAAGPKPGGGAQISKSVAHFDV